MTSSRRARLPVSVIVPTLNAADWIVECLTSIRANDPGEIIVVDGGSSDGTALLAEELATTLIRQRTSGPAEARNIGADAASKAWLAFIDADVVVPEGALAELLAQARSRKLGAIQAGLRSSGSDYWSEQLAWHHNAGRSRSWFGVSATLMRRSVFRAHRLDEQLASGEDVDLRLRLAAAKVRVAVSDTTVVDHRFAPGYPAARAQWLADGAGLGRLVRKFGRSALRQLAIPFAAAAYWMARSILAPRRLNYFIAFAIGNWLGALRGLSDYRVPVAPSGRPAAPTIGRAALILGAVLVIAAIIALVVGVLGLMAALRSPIVNAPFIPILAFGAVAILVFLQFTETLPEDHPTRQRIDSHRHAILILVIVTIVLAALRLLGTLRLLD